MLTCQCNADLVHSTAESARKTTFGSVMGMGSPGLDLVGFARLRSDLRLPSRARDWVAAVGSSYAGSEVLDTLKLLTSETTTNALQHGGASGVVRVALLTCPTGLRVEVTDEGGGAPYRARPRTTTRTAAGFSFSTPSPARGATIPSPAEKEPSSGSRSTPRPRPDTQLAVRVPRRLRRRGINVSRAAIPRHGVNEPPRCAHEGPRALPRTEPHSCITS
ncbi:ATP-binding protein [Actinocorallia aurea]